MTLVTVMNWIIQQTVRYEKSGIRWADKKPLEDPDFSDDLCLKSHRTEDQQQQVGRSSKKTTGLQANIEQTEVTKIPNN